MKTSKSKTDLWNKHYQRNKLKIDRLISFLKRRTKIVNKFYSESTIKSVSQHKLAKEKLYFLFLDCINAAGGNNLTNSAEATKLLLKHLDKLPNSRLIKFKDLTKIFNLKNSTTEELFIYLANGDFKNFRFKKAALFVRQIYYLQKSNEHKIFNDLEPKNIYKPIPLDTVISEIVSKVIGLQYKNRIKGSDGEEFNNWAIKILGKKEYYLLEDLWFWGYFSLRKDNKGFRKINYNEAKLITNPWIYPTYLKKHIRDINLFCKLIK